MTTQFKEPVKVFEEAINAGLLSRRCTDWNYFGHFTYCGTWEGVNQFRNCTGRLLIAPPQKTEAA